MAINLETAFASIVHSAPPRARLEAAFVTIVHTEAGGVATVDPGFFAEFLAGFFDEDKFHA